MASEIRLNLSKCLGHAVVVVIIVVIILALLIIVFGISFLFDSSIELRDWMHLGWQPWILLLLWQLQAYHSLLLFHSQQ